MTESNKLNKVNVLSVYFDNVTLEDMQENVKQFFLSNSPENLFIVTANHLYTIQSRRKASPVSEPAM